MSQDAQARSRHRIVRHTVTFEPDGQRQKPVTVCPRKLALIDVESCGGCPQLTSLVVNPEFGAPFMCCEVSDVPLMPEPSPSPAPRDSSQLRTMVSEIMTVPARCATVDTTLADALVLLSNVDAVPVVDEQGRALGLVSKTELLQCFYERRAADDVGLIALRDVSFAATFIVHGDASIVHVSAVMAYERVAHVVVVEADGTLRGMVSALDIVRWLACGSGYIVPER